MVAHSKGMWPLAFGKPDAASVMQAIPLVVWLRPVSRHERVGEHSAVVWNCVYVSPRCAMRLMFGVSIRPPNGSIAENPTSSSTMYTTLGEPSGAIGCRYGSQSGTESLMSMLMVPLNGVVMVHLGRVTARDLERRVADSRCRHPGWVNNARPITSDDGQPAAKRGRVASQRECPHAGCSGRYLMRVVAHESVDERRARGKAARDTVAPSGHAGWVPSPGRPDPVALLEEQNITRDPDLVPVRHGRMMVSPFTFYRGAAKIMAADLKDTPRAGLNVQLCGDAHLSNFGAFASPERTLLFDLNDFDETLPGPFEYDVKRMAASFTIAARNNGFDKPVARESTVESVSAYRKAMAEFAEMRTLDVWYSRITAQDVMDAIAQATRGQQDQGRQAPREERGGDGTEGTHPRQPASPVQTGRTGRRPVPDRQPATHRGARPRRGGRLRCLVRGDPARRSRTAPRLPGHAPRRPPTTTGTLRGGRRRPQGRGGRQRRHTGIHGVVAGPRSGRPAVLATQRSDRVGPRRPPAQEPVPTARRACGARPTADASSERHLLGLDQGCRGQPVLVLAATA